MTTGWNRRFRAVNHRLSFEAVPKQNTQLKKKTKTKTKQNKSKNKNKTKQKTLTILQGLMVQGLVGEIKILPSFETRDAFERLSLLNLRKYTNDADDILTCAGYDPLYLYVKVPNPYVAPDTCVVKRNINLTICWKNRPISNPPVQY